MKMENINDICSCLDFASGLGISTDKSTFLGSSSSLEKIKELVHMFRCKTGILPIIYLDFTIRQCEIQW